MQTSHPASLAPWLAWCKACFAWLTPADPTPAAPMTRRQQLLEEQDRRRAALRKGQNRRH